MRFLSDGPDIPDELIRAAQAGHVTFLCGAGVSMAAGLPNFRTLTERVYTALGEYTVEEAPEQRAFARQEYDRALRALEKRTRAPGSALSRVREAVASLLQVPPDADLSRHQMVLQVSADADGRPRVLTTNFDTLFERARAGSPSHATKALPKPGGAQDHGVLHLHGRLPDEGLRLEATDLVLKSEEHLTGEQVVAAWPKDAPAAADAKLLGQLTDTLKEALADATEAGVEGGDGLGASDTDIPSIARHKQNAYRSGFQEIARAMADIWERLLVKDAQRALDFVRSWSTMGFRLARRLAAFAAADRAVPAAQASNVLLALPQGEWFVTGACVEVHRLLKVRWGEWGEETRRLIEGRICQGPPRDWFNADADMQKILDRARFDLLGDMDRAGLALGQAAQATLRDVRERHPNWGLRPPEQAGFHSWQESHSGAPGDVAKLAGVADSELVDRALAMDAAEIDGNNWYAVCRADPSRALRGLQAKALSGARRVAAWERLLWPSGQPMRRDVAQAIAAALLEWP